jgi:uncharacterized low-complexity protein
MHKIATAAFMTGALLVPVIASSIAFADDSSRPGGSITTPESPTPANGGDQGWGNCGHNSSGGNPHTGDNGQGGGNGGDHGTSCGSVPTVSGGGGTPA